MLPIFCKHLMTVPGIFIFSCVWAHAINLVMTLLADEGGILQLTIFSRCMTRKEDKQGRGYLVWGLVNGSIQKVCSAAFLPGEER